MKSNEVLTVPDTPPELQNLPVAYYEPAEMVLKWLLEGHTEADILGAIREHLPAEDSKALIETVLQRLEAAGRPSRDVIRGFCYEAYRHLYKRMVAIGDFANALKAIKEIHNLTK